MRYLKRRPFRMLASLMGLVVASSLTVVLAESPAFASGSVIDIGYTIYSGGYVKGSGSDTNNGDWTNVCIAIMSQNTFLGTTETDTVACKSATGSHTWSAPDDWVGDTGGFLVCFKFWTRITAYKNGSQVANKNSNSIYLGPC
jgi:hypothetical protein